jgi:ABC-type dipeptide/oligopeptide/nickel transport system permease subunit
MIRYVGAFKASTWVFGAVSVASAIVAEMQRGIDPLVEVALITSISSLMVAIITGGVSIYLQRKTGRKVDGILSQAHAEEKQATSRADKAEGFREGSESERKP